MGLWIRRVQSSGSVGPSPWATLTLVCSILFLFFIFYFIVLALQFFDLFNIHVMLAFVELAYIIIKKN